MEAFLHSLLPWGTSVLKTLEGWRSPALTFVMKAITLLGNEEAYLLLLPLLYWSVHAPTARALFLLLFTSFSANVSLKHWLAIPRPGASGVHMLTQPGGFSFPSGHAQGTMTMWSYLAAKWKETWFRVCAIALIALVGFSRLYLGVHTPQDVMGGWLLGGLLVTVFCLLLSPLQRWFVALPWVAQLALAALYPLGLFACMPVKDNATICGVLLGFTIGTLVEQRWVGFSTDGPPRERALRYCGIVLVVAVWIGSKQVFPTGTGFRLLRYACVGVVVTALVPWGLVKLGLARSSLPHKQTEAEE